MGRYVEPEFLPWDGRRVPVTFLAGYLGSGKTTLINSVLATTDRPVAVFVNDVGSVNVDARLIRRLSGDTLELTDGCVCCSLSDGFGAAFDQLRAREVPPDHLVIELSGVADPTRVLPWGRSAGFRLDGVVTMIDAVHHLERVDDPIIGHTLDAQVAAADLLVITKTQMVEPDEVDRLVTRLAERVPGTPIVDAARHDPASTLQLGGRRPGGVTQLPTATLFDPHVTEIVELPDPIDLVDLEHRLDSLPDDTMRAKGVVVDPDGQRHLVQVVGRRRSVTVLPESEDEPPTDLVVIRLPR